MMESAGILPWRRKEGAPEVFLVHMGGPYWRKKERAWSIPKGIVEPGETPEEAARREFAEETGQRIWGALHFLGEGRSGSKKLIIYTAEAPEISERIHANTFRMEWPPGSGKEEEFPEVDRGAWMKPEEAKRVITKSQLPLLAKLETFLKEK